MAKKKFDDHYSDEEAQRRFEAALRGARVGGHEPMKNISPKRAKPHSTMHKEKAGDASKSMTNQPVRRV